MTVDVRPNPVVKGYRPVTAEDLKEPGLVITIVENLLVEDGLENAAEYGQKIVLDNPSLKEDSGIWWVLFHLVITDGPLRLLEVQYCKDRDEVLGIKRADDHDFQVYLVPVD